MSWCGWPDHHMTEEEQLLGDVLRGGFLQCNIIWMSCGIVYIHHNASGLHTFDHILMEPAVSLGTSWGDFGSDGTHLSGPVSLCSHFQICIFKSATGKPQGSGDINIVVGKLLTAAGRLKPSERLHYVFIPRLFLYPGCFIPRFLYPGSPSHYKPRIIVSLMMCVILMMQ